MDRADRGSTETIRSLKTKKGYDRKTVLRLSRTTFPTWAERSQIVESIDAGAVTVLPAHFNCIVSNRSDLHQLCIRHFDKSSLCSVALTKCAWAITAKINFLVLTHVTIVPSNPHRALGFQVIDLSRIWVRHRLTQNSAIAGAHHAARDKCPGASRNRTILRHWRGLRTRSELSHRIHG
jgi:hypothetical protein